MTFDPLLGEGEAAKLLGLSVATLRRERSTASRGMGIPYLRLGTAIRYQAHKLSAWLDLQAGQPTAETPIPKSTPTASRGRGRPRLLPEFHKEKNHE